jgi:hypothetical protein
MFLTRFTLLMPAFSLLHAPLLLTVQLPRCAERSPTTPTKVEARGFGTRLEPRYIFRAGTFDQ